MSVISSVYAGVVAGVGGFSCLLAWPVMCFLLLFVTFFFMESEYALDDFAAAVASESQSWVVQPIGQYSI